MPLSEIDRDKLEKCSFVDAVYVITARTIYLPNVTLFPPVFRISLEVTLVWGGKKETLDFSLPTLSQHMLWRNYPFRFVSVLRRPPQPRPILSAPDGF